MEDYCRTVEDGKALLKRRAGNEFEPENDQIVRIVATVLDFEGALLTHVLAKGATEIHDEAKWRKICVAAGWVVLQRYEHMVTKGEWGQDG